VIDPLQLVGEISSILFRADPVGIGHEANPDEYDPEAVTIATKLPEVTEVQQLRDVTHACFVQWFGAELAGPPIRYAGVAEQIWEAWQRHLAR
jgi:hypothetical protein